MAVTYKRNSNYRNTTVGKTELDLYVPALTPDFSQTSVLTLDQKYNRRPDLLAFDLYGDAKLWWLFVLFNRNQIIDPINDFQTGLQILIPNRNYVAGL